MELLRLELFALVGVRVIFLGVSKYLYMITECLRNTVDVSQGIQREGTLQ